MGRRGASAPFTFAWVPPGASETVTIPRSNGDTATFRSLPPLDEALSAARQASAPLPIRLCDEAGSETAAFLLPLPYHSAEALIIAAEGDTWPSSEAVENLVNQIAHDVRNFAFTIGLQAEMGSRRTDDALASGHFEAVLRQVDKLKAYLEALLLFGRPVRLEPRPFVLAAFIHEEVQRAHLSWRGESPSLALSISTEGDPGLVTWDRRTMGQALQAIVDNALRSAAPPPPVEIHLADDGDTVIIEVRDEGEGIPAEVLEKLVTPMVVRRAGGAGLGVAIARKMVRAHGGSLEIASGEGGTRVVMSLPREAPAG